VFASIEGKFAFSETLAADDDDRMVVNKKRITNANIWHHDTAVSRRDQRRGKSSPKRQCIKNNTSIKKIISSV
jgi:hypothetical protein